MNILVDKRLGMLKTSAVAAACLTLMSFLVACGGGAGSGNTSGWEKAITPPKLTVLSPPVGPTTGGTPVAITGTDIQQGATVVFGNVPAARINSVTSTSIEAVTPVHDPASVDVKVTNPDAGSDALLAAFTFAGESPAHRRPRPDHQQRLAEFRARRRRDSCHHHRDGLPEWGDGNLWTKSSNGSCFQQRHATPSHHSGPRRGPCGCNRQKPGWAERHAERRLYVHISHGSDHQ